MPEILKNKKILIGAGVVLLAILGYLLFSGGSGKETSSGGALLVTSISESPADSILGRDMLASLAKMKSIKLDDGIFSDPVFKSLFDFSVVVEKQPIGRRNPFAPIGQEIIFGVSGAVPPGGGTAPSSPR